MFVYLLTATLLIQSQNSVLPAPGKEPNIVGTAQSADPTVWRNDDVSAYLRTYGPDRVSDGDPFVAPRPPIPPENVVLTFPISPRADWLATYWSYDRDAQTMTIVVGEDESAATGAALVTESPAGTRLSMRGWALTARRGPPELDYDGRRQIEVRTLNVTGFGQVVSNTVPLRGRPTARVFSHTFAIEPEAARALSGELELRVYGKARPWRGDQRTLCVSDISQLRQGTIVRPCFLTGVLETYQVIDRRDGSVIHEWDAR